MTHPTPDGAVPPPGCPAHVPGSGPYPIWTPEFAANPGTAYDAMRRSYGAFAPVELATGVEATLVLTYDAALQVLRGTDSFGKDSRRWKAFNEGQVPADSPVVPMMSYRPNAFYAEGDEHRRLRGSIDDCLARIDPNALRGYIERSADMIIDRFASRGHVDLLSEYAKELPLRVLTQVFGATEEIGDRMYTGIRGIFDGIDAENANTILGTAILELIELRRREPGEDMVSWFLEHPSNLSQAELIDQLVVTTGAATEPQQNLIANALRLLLSDDRFAGSLNGGSMPVEDALEEVLWTDPPMANYGIHYPYHDVEINGQKLREGCPVIVSYASATNDPSIVTDKRAGNRAHLAWSAGPHGCPAQREARIIASVAIERLLDRLPDLELAVPVDELVWRPGPFHRALTALPATFPPVAPTRPALPPETPTETSGDPRWSAGPSTPTYSTPPAATSPARQSPSQSGQKRRPWSFLVRWWRGQ